MRKTKYFKGNQLFVAHLGNFVLKAVACNCKVVTVNRSRTKLQRSLWYWCFASYAITQAFLRFKCFVHEPENSNIEWLATS